MHIRWEEPAPIIKKKTKNEQLFEALMERPGQWGRIKTARSIKAARTQVFHVRDDARKHGGHWEFTARPLANNNGAIYGRFLGDDCYHGDQQFAAGGFVVST